MSFEAAHVSFLREKTNTQNEEPTIKVLSVSTFPSKEAADEALVTAAINNVIEIYNDKFVGFIKNEQELATMLAGSVALMRRGNRLLLWRIGESISRGYIYNSTALVPYNLGYYTFVETKINSLEQKTAVDVLESTIKELKQINNTLENESAIHLVEYKAAESQLRAIIHQRGIDCQNLLDEITMLRAESDTRINTLMALNAEVSELRKQARANDHGITTARMPISHSTNPIYSKCVNDIKKFDWTSLITKEQRDEKLLQRN